MFLPLSSVVIAVVLYLTVEVGWNETQFLLGRAVVEEQPFTLSKGVERLQRGPKEGLLSNELVGSLLHSVLSQSPFLKFLFCQNQRF